MSALFPLFASAAPTPARAPLPAERAAALAQDLVADLGAVFGPGSAQYDPALDTAKLAADLAPLLAAPAGPGPAAEQAAALAAFQRPLVARHALGPATWTLILDRVASHPQLAGHPFSAVAPQLAAALPRLPYLRALAAFLDARPDAASTETSLVEPALAVHALLSAEPGSALAHELSAALVPPTSTALLGRLGSFEEALAEQLRSSLEQTEVDEAAAAFAWLRRLHSVAPHLAGADPVADSALRAALAPEGVAAAPLFRLRLTGHHRVVEGAAATALQASANRVASAAPEDFPAARAAARSLAALARDLAAWPAALLDSLPEKGPAFLARILVEEHRLRRPAAARAAAFRRIALGFGPATGAPLSALPAALQALAALAPWRAPEPAAALDALRAALPALETATLLLDGHLALGADTARRAYAAQPAYARLTGPAGEKACAKDNALTLRQLALLLLDGQPQPAERLQAWWNAVVGVHLVNRPPQLFAHNLRSLHAALRAALPPSALDLVFSLVHQLYKEAIGIPDSPLLHFGAYPAPALPALDPAPLAEPAFRKRHLRRVAALAGGNAGFVAAWTAWLDRPETGALPALASSSGAEAVARALSLLLGDLLRELGPTHPAGLAAATLPERLATGLLATHLERPAPDEDPCLRDLGLIHGYLAEQLQTRPTAHALLQTLRFVIEILGPHLVEGPDAWEKNISAAHLALERDCPALARPLLARWTDTLRALGPRLVALRPFLHLAYPAGHPVLATTASVAEEKSLRGALAAALLPHLLPASAPWSSETLRALAAHSDSVPAATTTERLVAFLDTLFDQLDGAHYYDLLAILSTPPSAAPAPPPGPALSAAHAAPLPKAGLLAGLFGPPPEHLAHDLALATSLAPDWLAPLLPELAPEEHRPAAAARAAAFNASA